jgi:hypothetical protein
MQMLRQAPSKAVVSTFIRSQVLLGSLAEFLPTTGAVFVSSPATNRAGVDATARRTHVP